MGSHLDGLSLKVPQSDGNCISAVLKVSYLKLSSWQYRTQIQEIVDSEDRVARQATTFDQLLQWSAIPAFKEWDSQLKWDTRDSRHLTLTMSEILAGSTS